MRPVLTPTPCPQTPTEEGEEIVGGRARRGKDGGKRVMWIRLCVFDSGQMCHSIKLLMRVTKLVERREAQSLWDELCWSGSLQAEEGRCCCARGEWGVLGCWDVV